MRSEPTRESTAASAAGGRLTERIGRYLQIGSTFMALVVIAAVLSFASPYFLTASNLMNILLQAATIAIIAAGFTVALIAAEIDLSIGSMIGMTGSVAAVAVIQLGVPWPLGAALALAAGLLAGLFNGYATVVFRMPSFVVTLAMLGMAQGAGLLLTNGRPISGFPEGYSFLGQGRLGPVPMPVVIAGAVYVALHLLLTRTRFGIELYATGGNRRAAELAGIAVDRIVVVAFAISGFCGGLAGVVLSSRLDAGNGNFGAGNLLDAVAAVVVGGTSLMGGVGSVIGTLGGVLIIATIRNGLILMNVQAFWQQVAVGAIIIVAVVINKLAKGELTLTEFLPRTRHGAEPGSDGGIT